MNSKSDNEILKRHVAPTKILVALILPAPSAIVAPSSEFPLALVALTVRKSVRPLPSYRFALRYTSHHMDRFTSGSSSSHSPSDHSSSRHFILGHSLSRHTPPDTTDVDSSTPQIFVHPPLARTSWCSEAYLSWRSAPLSTIALVPSRTDLLIPCKRFMDSFSLEDNVEEDIDMDMLEDIKSNETAIEVAVDRDVEAGIDAGIGMEVNVGIDVEDEVEDEVESSDRGTIKVGVDMDVGIDISNGMLMPNVVEHLEQDEFRQVCKDHDDTRRRLRRLESFVERRLGFLTAVVTAVASPVRVLELDTHSSSEADPSKKSLPPVSVAYMVLPFLCFEDSKSDNEILKRHVAPTKILVALILPAPSAIVAPSSEFPLALVVAPLEIRQRQSILIRPGEDIHIDHSSSRHFILGHSLSRHTPPDTTDADSSTLQIFVHLPLARTSWCSEAYLSWRTSFVRFVRIVMILGGDLGGWNHLLRDVWDSVLSLNTTITRSGMTPEAIKELINRCVEEALAAFEVTRAANAFKSENQSQNGSDGDNGNGHYRSDYPKLKDQNHGNKSRNKNGVGEARGKAYVLGGGDANPYLNGVKDVSYAYELADGRVSETNTVLRGCALGLLGCNSIGQQFDGSKVEGICCKKR
nr:hypothetical protein [Tanacetum cinerariifolium]